MYNFYLFSLKLGNFRQSWTKVLTHLSKTNAFYQRASVIGKKNNVEIHSVDTVMWLQHWKGERGWKCENWRLKNSRVQQNRSFWGSVSTAFVHDCRSCALCIFHLQCWLPFENVACFITCIRMNFLFVYSVYSVLGSHTIGSPSRFVTHYGMGHTIKHRYGPICHLFLSLQTLQAFWCIQSCNCT